MSLTQIPKKPVSRPPLPELRLPPGSPGSLHYLEKLFSILLLSFLPWHQALICDKNINVKSTLTTAVYLQCRWSWDLS